MGKGELACDDSARRERGVEIVVGARGESPGLISFPNGKT